jgi:hypothetical protein
LTAVPAPGKKAKPADIRADLSGVLQSVTVHWHKAETTAEMQVAAIEVEMSNSLINLFTSQP